MDPLPPIPSQRPPSHEGALGALLAVSRLLAVAQGTQAPAEVHEALVREARTCFGASGVLLVAQEPGRRLRVLGGDAPSELLGRHVDLDAHRGIAELLDRRVRLLRADAPRARDLGPLLERGDAPNTALLLLLRATVGLDAALVLTGLPSGAPQPAEVDVVTAFADAGAAALERLRVNQEHERQAAQQQALTRAAKTLNESLDVDKVLARICHEAATILGSDVATVYRGTPEEGITIAAAFGIPPEAVGYRLPLGSGLAGKVLLQGRAMLTNDYQRIADLPADAPFAEARSALAAPMVWEGGLRGVLSVGYMEQRGVDHEDLHVLETFAELAATACANADAHAGLAQAARTDGLTGCLNHAALHEGLAREIDRAARVGGGVSLVLVDLDHFKQVNEAHGHLAGDEVLRRAGHALRHATRPYDLAARYGGDEFALVAVGSGEQGATEIGNRALERLGKAIAELLPPGATPATGGVAEWTPGLTPTELIARADRALLFAKQEGARGRALPFSAVPDDFEPGNLVRHERGLPEPPPMPGPGAAPPPGWPARLDERLRRRTRQLALANELGARIAAMTDPMEIVEATVEELHRAFGYYCVGVMRHRADDLVDVAALRGTPFDEQWSQPADVGVIGRCLRTRRSTLVNDVSAEPEYRPAIRGSEVQAEMVVPLWVGDDLWGVIDVEETTVGAFGDDDLLLLQTVAAQVGSAMRSALLYERLERAYLGTAEALAAALEAKDAYTADHARSIVEQAEAVGLRLGLSDEDLRDLRFAAVFHDIGKIAVPEAILHKDGPLNAEERGVMERHTVVGEQILQPVEFLAGVRRLVRHEHERWDGRGYPDGLRGLEIPLGSRIILACDALHAMTSNRPYRKAMSFDRAIEELRANAGTQFDPEVVEALVEVLGA